MIFEVLAAAAVAAPKKTVPVCLYQGMDFQLTLAIGTMTKKECKAWKGDWYPDAEKMSDGLEGKERKKK